MMTTTMTNQQRAAMQMALEALFTYEEDWPEDNEGGVYLRVGYDDKKVLKAITALREALAQPQWDSLEEYDAGYLNDFGGGNVEWWHDYIRSELGRAYDYYQSQLPTAQPQGEWVDLTRDDVESLFWPWKAKTEYEIPLFEYRVIAAEVIAKFKEKNTLFRLQQQSETIVRDLRSEQPPVVQQVVTEGNASEVRSTDTGEPVAWLSQGGMFTTDKSDAYRWIANGFEATPLYTAPPVVPQVVTEGNASEVRSTDTGEPVAWGYFDADGSLMDAVGWQHGAYQTPLYTTSPSVEANDYVLCEVQQEWYVKGWKDAAEKAAKLCDEAAYKAKNAKETFVMEKAMSLGAAYQAEKLAAAIRGMK